MSVRLPLAAATALLGLAAFATPVFAIEQIHIPDSSAAENSGPPDALFDKSIPTTWQQKADQKQSGGLGQFHFSVSGGNGFSQYQGGSGYGEDAKVPNSEFQQNRPAYQDPLLPQ